MASPSVAAVAEHSVVVEIIEVVRRITTPLRASDNSDRDVPFSNTGDMRALDPDPLSTPTAPPETRHRLAICAKRKWR